MTKDEIRDEVAREQGFRDWSALQDVSDREYFEKRKQEVELRYAQSQTQELQEQNREIVESNESLTSKLKEAKSMIGRLRRSMSVHPDCTSGSEFDDYTTDAQSLEDEIEELLTKNNHLKSNTNG